MQRRRLPDDRFNKFRGKRQGQNPNTYRLFVAVFPPDEYLAFFRDTLRKFDKEKRNLRNIPVDQIHMTLKFIGSQVSEYSKDQITESLQKFSGNYPKPVIKIDGVQFGYPQQVDPRIILASVTNNDDLDDLAEVVHQRIRDLRLFDTIRWKEKGKRQFHISLSRLKDSASESHGRSVLEIVRNLGEIEFPEEFTAEYIDLVQSVIAPGSVTYKRLGRIKL